VTLWKCFALIALLTAKIPAATLVVGTASGNAGQTLNLSIALQAQGAQVAGVQFDLVYDNTALTVAVGTGAAASAAGKSVSTNSLPTGIRVLIVGLNQTVMADGNVADLTISVAANATSGSHPLTISGASGTDPSGQAISVSASPGAVVVSGDSPGLAVSLTHSGTFAAGQLGAYRIVVSNPAGSGATQGTVTVLENLPIGLTLISMAGAGWNCSGPLCSRSDSLNGGASYPAIDVSVNIANNAPSSIVNQVVAGGGGSSSSSASDTVTLTASLLRQTIVFASLNDVSFGVSPFSLSATASSGLPVSFASTTQSVCTVSGSTLAVAAVGTCSITATQAGNGTFAAAEPISRDFQVVKGEQRITFAPLDNLALGASPITLTATSTSGLAVVFTSTTLSVCTVTGNRLSVIAAGTCTVVASQPGNANYAAASTVTRTLTVTRADRPLVSQGGIVPIYSTRTTVQAGSWISIYGSNLSMSTVIWDGNFPMPESLGGVSVTVNGKPGFLWSVSATQINLQVPDDTATGSVSVVVTTPAGASTSTVTLGAASPSLSLLDTKHVAALTPNTDGGYDIVGPSGAFPYATRPVAPGAALVLYGVGFGATDPLVKSGEAVTAAAATVNPVTVTIGGVNAPVTYSGIVGVGLYQINVTVPAGIPSGDQPITAAVSGIQTDPGRVVTIQ